MNIKKLVLNRETLRSLSERESMAAVGGLVYTEIGKRCWNDATGGDTFGIGCRTTVVDCAPATYTC